MRIKIRKNTNAFTAAFSAILVTLVVTSTVGTVVLWGVPYVDTLSEKKEQENVERQIDAVVGSIADLAGSRPGNTDTTYVATGEGGSVSVDKDEDRLVLLYSYQNDYTFTVRGLSLYDEQPDVFEIQVPYGLADNLCSRAVISWLDFDTCFLAGTKVVMADESYKNIEDITVGDIVKSYDIETKAIVDGRVSYVYHHTPEEMTDHYLIINNQLRVTPNHRFYSDYKWIYAGDLRFGDLLFCMEQNMAYSVYSVDRFYERVPTFDLEVEHCHTYFIYMYEDAVDVLVHNPTGGGGGDNTPPYNPSNPLPTHGATGISITADLSWIGGDPDGDPVTYNVYFGKTNPPAKKSGNQSSTTYDTGTMDYSTKYYWKIVAWDNHGASTTGPIWNFTTEANYPPNTPNKPTGPISGSANVPYTYQTSATDPNGNKIKYGWDWNGDYVVDQWTGLYTSGATVNTSHSWANAGSYNISVKAKDEYNLESGFSEKLWVNISPVNLPPYKPVNPTPSDGACDIDPTELLTLSVTVFDPENDIMNVSFIDASSHPHKLIEDKIHDVPSGDPVSVVWKNLESEKEYRWYVIVEDDKSSSTWSDTWSFTTMKDTDEVFSDRGSQEDWSIQTGKSLEGAVVIKLYNEDYSRFGKIFIFDSNSVTYNIRSNDDVKNIVLENGGIVYSSSGNTYIKNGLSAHEESGFFKLSVVQMVETSHSSSSVSGMSRIRINTEFKGSAVTREDAKGGVVYDLRLQFSGDHKDIWSTYFNETYNFAIHSVTGEPDFLEYKYDGIRLMLWHSYIAFSLM